MKSFFNMKKKKHSTTVLPEQEREMILSDTASFHVKEAYKATRTNTMFSIPGEGCKKIVVASSFPGEGKSTTCLNLAITFAQTGSKVLVIDADLRKPTIHRKLDLANEKGLAHLLGHFCKVEEAIIPTQYENLEVITSGHIPPNPAELLASESMTQILDTLSAQYDYIFLDTPPLNVVTDATVLSTQVSGTVLVVRQGVTHHKDMQDAVSKLEFAQGKILGLILHGVKDKKAGYGKYSKYSKYSQYGYKNSAYTQYGE
ncbi:CpsD/CapB family tyrosine-protein kinase [Niameybacter sp.]|uniref:CpsD/CapB family tyrosine-protein kinase n=1 Tax=Niameybacter sp. TaxID=2033640 RepID=UPI002FC6D7EF